jgi:hypothetical protein
MREALHCGDCGELIGVYEPVIVVSSGAARETSHAAEPTLRPGEGQHFHQACYLAAVALRDRAD